MKLDLNCKNRIVERLAELLKDVTVLNKIILNWQSTNEFHKLDVILPDKGKLKNQLEEYISDTPLYDFISEKLSLELFIDHKYDHETGFQRLDEISGYENLSTIAERLITEFESLPQEYIFIFEINPQFSELFKKIQCFELSEFMKISYPDDLFLTKFRLPENLGRFSRLLGTDKKPIWNKTSAYIEINMKGFIGLYGATEPINKTISILKSFSGLALALNLFDYKNKFEYANELDLTIHELKEDKVLYFRTYNIDRTISEVFKNITLSDHINNLQTEDEKIKAIEKKLLLIKTIFSNIKKTEKLFLSSQWLFDSYYSGNNLLSFIQATIVLEILLGDKAKSDILGIKELLSNRCAYLISRDHSERQDILNRFAEIYTIRSNIVHKGKSRLNVDELNMFYYLQWLCHRVIQEEIKLLCNEIDT